MELRQLRYFATLARTLHFGRAAAAEHIAPSAFSTQIARLEREVGCRLVERTSRQVRLTAAGLALAEHAHLTLDSAEQAVRAARNASQGLSGQLTLGLLDGGAGAELTVPIVQAFKTTHPAVAVRLRALTHDTHLQALLDGGVDAVLGPSFADSDDRYVTTPLFTDPRMALLPAAHALADSPTSPSPTCSRRCSSTATASRSRWTGTSLSPTPGMRASRVGRPPGPCPRCCTSWPGVKLLPRSPRPPRATPRSQGWPTASSSAPPAPPPPYSRAPIAEANVAAHCWKG